MNNTQMNMSLMLYIQQKKIATKSKTHQNSSKYYKKNRMINKKKN